MTTMRAFSSGWLGFFGSQAVNPPGPQKSHWLLGDLKSFISNPPEYLNGVAQRYGPISLIPLALNRVYLINDPELVREVLVTQSDAFIKDGKGREVMGRALGSGLVTSEGSLHKRQRKLVQPAFQNRRIETYAPVMTELTAQHIWR